MKVLFNGYDVSLPNNRKKIWGGPQIFTNQLVEYMQNHKYEFVGVILDSDKNYSGIYEVSRIPDLGGSWLRIKTALNIVPILKSKSANIERYSAAQISMFAEIFREEKPDVVLLNGFSMKNWYLLRAAHAAKIPVVVSHHGLWFKEISEIAKVTPTLHKITEEMERDIVRYADHEIFLNEYSMEEFENKFGKIPKRRRNIIPITYNPVFANGVKAKRKIKNKGELKIGFVGRWDPIKNPQIILKLAQKAKSKKLPWKFFAVTSFNNSKKLKPFVKKFSTNIEIIQNLKPKQLQKFYKKMDILLLPSRFDVSPTVVAEAAMQHKGTVISESVGWVNEYKKFGMGDWILDFSDKGGTLQIIGDLAARSLPENFVNYIRKYHSAEQVMPEIFKVLKSVKRKK